MSVALFVRFERDVTGLDGAGLSGEALARNLDLLEEAAVRLDLTPLLDFHSESEADYDRLLHEENGEDTAVEEAPVDPCHELRGQEAVAEFRALGEEIQGIDEVLEAMREDGVPAERWFAPADGLRTVQGLDAYVREHPGDFLAAADLGAELVLLERFLRRADEAAVRFHFSFDL